MAFERIRLSLDDWEMHSDRNVLTREQGCQHSLDDWEMHSDRNYRWVMLLLG